MGKYDWHKKCCLCLSGRKEWCMCWISKVSLMHEKPGQKQQPLSFHWVKLIKWVKGGWIGRQTEEKSARTEGWLLTRHLARDCFSLGEGRRKEEIAGMSTWPSTCLAGKLVQNQTPKNTCAHAGQAHTYAKVLRVSREESAWRWTTWPAGCWHLKRWRLEDEITVPPVGCNHGGGLSRTHTRGKRQTRVHVLWNINREGCMPAYTHTASTFFFFYEHRHTRCLAVSLGVCSECLCLLHMWPHA